MADARRKSGVPCVSLVQKDMPARSAHFYGCLLFLRHKKELLA
jgi:hypothetical protein